MNPSRRTRLKAKHDRWYGRDGPGDFAAFVRSQGCFIARLHRCVRGAEAASLDKANRREPGASGVGRIVGLCAQAHAEQEANTERFEERYGVKLSPEGVRLAELWKANGCP